MKHVMNLDRRFQIISDLLKAELDIIGLAHKHGLDHDDLSQWAMKGENQRCLAGLCVLADFQTQLLLSRFRAMAANRLIRLATGGEDGELARKACVDLLKITVKTTEPAAEEDAAPLPLELIRKLVYGEESEPSGEAALNA